MQETVNYSLLLMKEINVRTGNDHLILHKSSSSFGITSILSNVKSHKDILNNTIEIL